VVRGISFLLFTYNPDLVIIKRVLQSIQRVQIPESIEMEYLVIDNKSTSDWLIELKDEIKSFPFQVIEEKRQGLTFSRIKGFELAKGDWIICVDDDNELKSNYLIELQTLIADYPQVCVWGPGKIAVEYLQGAPEWVINYKGLFQEKNFSTVQYGNEHHWMFYYPAGTGMCLSSKVAQAYLSHVASGKMTASDRKGKSLSSGGDSQVVYAGILSGKAAGVAPSLQANHLIGEGKTNLEYMKRLNFGVSSCWSVHIEVFPEMRASLKEPNFLDFLSFFFLNFWKSRFGYNAHRFQIPLAKHMGTIYSYYDVNHTKMPFIYRKIIQFYKFR
jgi:glycosyltransferase involved in cell wall biosynthesis